MKNKVLYTILLCFLCFPLFLFPVYAEEVSSELEYDNYEDFIIDNAATFLSEPSTVASGFDNSSACIYFLELPYAQRQAIQNLSHIGSDNNLVLLSNTGSVFTFNGAWFQTSSFTNGDTVTVTVNSEISNKGVYKINTDGSIALAGTQYKGVPKAIFYWNHNTGGYDPLGTITFDPGLCSVGPVPTSTPFPTDDPFACNFALNEVIGNDYVASLVAYAEKQNFTEPYYIYRVYYTDSADDMNILASSGIYTELEPFSIKGYVLALQGYSYPQTYVLEYKQLRKLCTDSVCAFAEFDMLDSMMYPFYELVLTSTCLERGEFSEIQATQDVNASIQQTITQNATSISNQNTLINQNQQIIDSSNKTNDLIENGNDVTQSFVDTSDTYVQFSELITEGIGQFEADLFDSLYTGAFEFESLVLPSDFANTALFVRSQFQDIWNMSPLGVIISFALMVGVASLLFGRKGS